MLFHITHRHNHENCPAHYPDKLKATFGKMLSSAEGLGVKLISVVIDPPGHPIFLIVDVDNLGQIEDLLDPVFELGTAETRPVVNALEAISKRLN